MSGNVINKKINIEIKDITEGNRQQKFEQLAKCLNGHTPEYVPADNTARLPDIKISLKNNEPARVEKALRTMSMSLRLPGKAAKGEVFFYKAQEDLTDKWCDYFSNYIQNIYDFVTEYCDLPKKTVMSKAENLTYKGKILYSPSTGEPIKKADWEKFLKNLEKFLNRNNDNPAERIVLQSQCLAKILNRMLKYNTLEAVKKLRLEDTVYHGKSFDWLSKDIKNMKDVFGEELTRQEQARIAIYQQSAAVKVQNVTEKVRGEIQQVLIDGVRAKKSKSQVSQDLFDKMVGDNRDYQRLADTEVQNAFNNSYIREEVQNTPKNKKTYFRRIEIIDGNTCPFCRQMNGKIAVWSDKPLQSDIAKDPIADYVLWEGKEWNGKEHTVAIGCFHSWCRGTWERYDESDAHIDALIAESSNRAKKWNNAVKQATKEFEEKGVKNPDDSTRGFTDRIQEIFSSEDVQKSLNGEKDNHTRHYFSESELRKRGEELIKIYEKICKETGLDMETVVNRYGITKDGCYYDLENPKEKFYYDLKMKFAEIDKTDDFEKSSKYIKRWFSNGEWHYKYPPKYKENQNRTETKKDIAQSTKLITGIKPLEAKTEKDIDDAIVQLALYANENELKCTALGNHRIYVTERTQEHIKETHNKPRTDAEMKHKAKYIPFVPEILKHGKICEKSSSKEGVIYGIIGQVEYFDKKKNKNVIESVELAINYDKDSRKFVFSFADKSIKKSLFNNRDINDTFSVCPIVDTETVPITVYSLSETPILSSGTLNKSMSDKLFALWTRRLSPEFCNELKKLMHDDEGFRLIPKKVYEIPGYPEGQDLENCDLLELSYDYFVISCGGDWQDEKLVKFEIGKNDKLSASVISKCKKEDKRDLRKKVAYILNTEITEKSLTWSGHKLQGRTTFNGLNISIENKKGSIRRGTDSDGHEWAITMHYDYGYIRGTEGVDGDHVDCYLGGNEDAKNVYIIHQKIPGTDKYDEDKCMLGFDTLADAKAAYLRQYDKPGFFGGVDTVPFDVFKEKVLSKKWHGKRLNLK